MDFATLMALEPHGADTYVGRGAQYPWGGLYGGHIVAQALQAASLTVEPQYGVHSLHAYFIRRGDHAEPIRFEVDRVRNGRSFVTRNVIARQAVGAILSMSASFQVDEDSPADESAVMPDVPGPDDSDASTTWSDLFDRRFVRRPGVVGEAAGWMRIYEPLGDDPLLNACALAYLSDDLPTDAVAGQYPGGPTPDDYGSGSWYSASLDHAIWFHRPVQADQWHLHHFLCDGIRSSRGLSVGHVFTTEGTRVATIAQEVLFRRAR